MAGIAGTSGSVIASGAKQSRNTHYRLDCFGAAHLAMTESNSRAPERLLDLAGDHAVGEPDVVQVMLGPAGELGALHAAHVPGPHGLQNPVEHAVSMKIYH